MIDTLYIIIASGFLAILYGYIVGKQIISASPGNSKMIEIASAIQEGARAYLNRQYKTITMVGIIVLITVRLFMQESRQAIVNYGDLSEKHLRPPTFGWKIVR